MLPRSLTAGFVLLTAAAVHSVDSRPTPAAADEAGRPSSTAVVGMKVVMDPATGRIVGQPTADELGRVGLPGRAERRGAHELERFDLPNGARGIVLGDWADHTMRVERDADGTLRIVCAPGDRHGDER